MLNFRGLKNLGDIRDHGSKDDRGGTITRADALSLLAEFGGELGKLYGISVSVIAPLCSVHHDFTGGNYVMNVVGTDYFKVSLPETHDYIKCMGIAISTAPFCDKVRIFYGGDFSDYPSLTLHFYMTDENFEIRDSVVALWFSSTCKNEIHEYLEREGI